MQICRMIILVLIDSKIVEQHKTYILRPEYIIMYAFQDKHNDSSPNGMWILTRYQKESTDLNDKIIVLF